MSKIIVNLSGWFEADPDRTMFQYVGLRYDVEKLISGQQWLALPENDRSSYVLENIATAYKYSLDGDYDRMEIEVEE
jgi:hypothetical protein